MREIRQYGSEGGEEFDSLSLPLSRVKGLSVPNPFVLSQSAQGGRSDRPLDGDPPSLPISNKARWSDSGNHSANAESAAVILLKLQVGFLEGRRGLSGDALEGDPKMAEVGEAGGACDACKVRRVRRTQHLLCMIDTKARDDGIGRTAEHVLEACFKAPAGSVAAFNKKFDAEWLADVFLNVLDEPFQLW